MGNKSRPLKILHIDTEKSWRGGQQQVYWLIEGLAQKGIENHVVVWKGGELSKRLGSVPVSLYPIRPFSEFDFISAHKLNRWMRKEQFDVVHAHSGHGVALGRLALLGTKIPFVITRRVDFHLHSSIFSKWKYCRAQKIIAISNGVKKSLLESCIEHEKIVVIPSGVSLSRFANVRKAIPSEMGVPDDAIIIGQVAALAPHKDQATFLEAIFYLKEKEPRVYAVIVGEGALRKDLSDHAKWLGIENSVRFLGFKDDPLHFLAAFHIFCLSSQEEGLGTSLLDAMGLGIPIVATQAGGIPDVVEDHQTGILVPPKNPQLMADALLKLIRDKDLRNKFVEDGYVRVKDFNIQETVQKTEELYLSLLGQPV